MFFPWKACFVGFAIATILSPAQRVNAATFNFSYSQTFCGAAPGTLVCPANGVVGTGSFSFADGLTNISLASLTSFTFTDIIGTLSDRVTFTLANLGSFSATATAGSSPALNSLIFATTNVGSLTSTAGLQAFSVSSLAFQGGSLRSQGNTNSLNSAGQITNISYVPEPSSALGMLVVGASGALTLLRRRRLMSASK
ncbi:MAG: PEP-CTERM sorting domain-containing protein [Anaerolineae bacterium]|nr:PEP-CTERM sorting domain-containing protein [Gloeobacterales cyanobacterium ES-bin-313]